MISFDSMVANFCLRFESFLNSFIRLMTSSARQPAYFSVIAIACLGFISACVVHEVVGHGGMCLARGDRITLLTSVYFHCSQDTTITTADGNLMNLAVAAICFALLRFRLSPGWRLLLVFAAAFNSFWACGYIILSAVTDNGDWAFVLHDLALNPPWLWRGLMALLGVALYYIAIRLVVPRLPRGIPILIPTLAAGVVACLAALFYAGPVLPALRDSAQEGVGLLLIARARYRRGERSQPETSLPPSGGWVVAAIAVVVVFVATLGRGLIG
jgi:hypothetical protein